MAFGPGIHVLRKSFLAAVIAVALPAAHASIVYVNSDLTNEANNISGSSHGIPVSPAWALNGTGYEWISYADTGCNTFLPGTGTCTGGPANPVAIIGDITLSSGTPATPTAIFYKNFSLADAVNTGYISVWADDTARVYLDTAGGQVLLMDANPNLGGNCAGAPVGCRAGMQATFDVAAMHLSSGDYTLEIQAYQLIGGSPFGVMYTGRIESQPGVPEPGSYLLLGLGLAGLGILVRWRK